jgi:hypothetical protein
LLAAAVVDDAVAEELAEAELEELEEQAARASVQISASPAIRRIRVRRSLRVMGPSVQRPLVRESSGS